MSRRFGTRHDEGAACLDCLKPDSPAVRIYELVSTYLRWDDVGGHGCGIALNGVHGRCHVSIGMLSCMLDSTHHDERGA